MIKLNYYIIIIINRFKNDKWEAISLSIDQKPDDPKEMERIISRGGRVEPFKDYNGEPCGTILTIIFFFKS